MSSRYGRNKKRRHRERIAALEKALTSEQVESGRGRRVSRDLDRKLQGLLEQLRAITPFSVLLPPLETEWNPGPFWEQSYVERVPQPWIRDEEERYNAPPITTLTLNTAEIRAWVERLDGPLRRWPGPLDPCRTTRLACALRTHAGATTPRRKPRCQRNSKPLRSSNSTP